VNNIQRRVGLLPLPNINLVTILEFLHGLLDMPLGLIFFVKLLPAGILLVDILIFIQKCVGHIDINVARTLSIISCLLHLKHLLLELVEVNEREQSIHSVDIYLLVVLFLFWEGRVKGIDLLISKFKVSHQL